MSKRDDYQKTMEEQLDLFGARAKALAENPKQLEEWRAEGDRAGTKLTELKATSGDAWDVTKIEMEKVWKGVAAALDRAEAAKRASEDGVQGPAQALAAVAIPVPVVTATAPPTKAM